MFGPFEEKYNCNSFPAALKSSVDTNSLVIRALLLLLPPNHPPILFVSDKNHRVRSFGKSVFALAAQPKKTCVLTSLDAKRLKRYFSYYTFGSQDEDSLQKWMSRGGSVYEHLFDDHKLCGSWCPVRKMTEEEQKDKKKKYYHKRKDMKLYLQLKRLLDPFFERKVLKSVFHYYTTNKCESLNMSIARLFPKNKYLQGTFSGEGRVCLAVVVDSIGFEKGLCMVQKEVGLPWLRCQKTSLMGIDWRNEQDLAYHAKKEVRARKAQLVRKKCLTKS